MTHDPRPQAARADRVPVIGIVGGVASGKSTVADCFRQLGAVVIDADQLGHAVLRVPEVIAALKEHWGPEVLDADGQVNRRAVAERVFDGSAKGRDELAFLEAIVHPRIGLMLSEEVERCRADPSARAVVVDAAMMLEAGWDHHCDHILFVDTPPEVRRQRAAERGWSAQQLAAREAAQMDVDVKRLRADSVLPNQGSKVETCQLVRQWWRQYGPVLAHGPADEYSA